MRTEGDNYITGTHTKLWQLVFEILTRWGILCTFKHREINVPTGLPEQIMFFVPKDATFHYEIISFLEHELENNRHDPHPMGDGEQHWPGTEVMILPYSGQEFYIERDRIEEIAKNMMQQLIQSLKSKKEDKDES